MFGERAIPGLRLIFAIAGVASPALAEPVERGALSLEWSAPGGCPNVYEALERVEVLLGRPLVELTAASVTARGAVREVSPERFELELETFQHEQRFVRGMQAPSCLELTDAGALVLALAIDPTLAERRAAEAARDERVGEPAAFPAEPAPPPPEPPEPTPPAPSPPKAPDPSERRTGLVRFPLRVAVLGDAGTVGTSALGLRAGPGVRFGAAELDVQGLWLLPRRSYATRDPDKGGDIDLLALSMLGCWLPVRASVELRTCVAFEAGRLHGHGFGTAANDDGSVGWLAAGGALLLALPIGGGVFAVGGVSALVHPKPIEFTLENIGVVHELPPLVVRAELGLEAQIP